MHLIFQALIRLVHCVRIWKTSCKLSHNQQQYCCDSSYFSWRCSHSGEARWNRCGICWWIEIVFISIANFVHKLKLCLFSSLTPASMMHRCDSFKWWKPDLGRSWLLAANGTVSNCGIHSSLKCVANLTLENLQRRLLSERWTSADRLSKSISRCCHRHCRHLDIIGESWRQIVV